MDKAKQIQAAMEVLAKLEAHDAELVAARAAADPAMVVYATAPGKGALALIRVDVNGYPGFRLSNANDARAVKLGKLTQANLRGFNAEKRRQDCPSLQVEPRNLVELIDEAIAQNVDLANTCRQFIAG
jgi:hypothetical protein